jgi:ferrochelatase
MDKTGVLLINIGSPKTYETNDVSSYLKTFLMDEDIINLPYLVRWFLVHGIIVPRRAHHSAENYRKIWMEGEGSPLTVYTQRFSSQLQNLLGDNYSVKVGMRYSEPSIEQALKDLSAEGVKDLLVAPLYPQYAEATTGSSLKEVKRLLLKLNLNLKIKTIPPFYADRAFIDPTIKIIKKTLQDQPVDHYVFSFHGLPVSQIKRNKGCLLNDQCCAETRACQTTCYRSHCHQTARILAKDSVYRPTSGLFLFSPD